jgi:hypothetical protein
MTFPTPAGYADPPSEAGFAFLGSRCRGLAETELGAQRIPRAPQVCAIIASPSTRQAVTLARSDGIRLDDKVSGTVFLEIRNKMGGKYGMTTVIDLCLDVEGPTQPAK